MVGGKIEHIGQAGADLFGIHVGVQFVGEGNYGVAVLGSHFPEFQGVVVLNGLAVGHGLAFMPIVGRIIENTKLVDIFH